MSEHDVGREVAEMCEQVRTWLSALSYRVDPEPVVITDAHAGPESHPRKEVLLQTASVRYRIVFGPNHGNGYLGCTAIMRVPDPGEDWLRGRDLPDGSFSDETWGRILARIVAFEVFVAPARAAA